MCQMTCHGTELYRMTHGNLGNSEISQYNQTTQETDFFNNYSNITNPFSFSQQYNPIATVMLKTLAFIYFSAPFKELHQNGI